MESSAKSENTVAPVADTDTPTATSVPETIENAQIPVPVEENKPLSASNEIVAVEDQVVTVVAATEVIVNDTNGSCNSAPIEDDKLNEAMASTTISTIDSTDAQLNNNETSLDEDLSDTTEKKSTIVDNTNVKPDASEKVLSSPDEATDVDFENACESIDNENYVVKKEQHCDKNQQECLADGQSVGENELVDGEDVGAKVRNYNIIYS